MAKRWIQSADVAIDEATGEWLVRTGGAITVQRAKIDCDSDAGVGNELVAAVAGKRICVLARCLMAADAVNATFYSGPADAGTAVSGPMPLGANGGFVLDAPADPAMHAMETAEGEALTIGLDAAVQVSGWLLWYEA